MPDMPGIRRTLDELIVLLQSVGEANWCRKLQCMRDRAGSAMDPADERAFVTDILRLYGGMGSLNDLGLYRDGVPLQSENKQLDELTSRLFHFAHEWHHSAREVPRP